ncbi:phosphatase PAP2 family protein [Kitasatospora acidiphila]|uniref:phosphatase PAP2 family protein n=1 Tax=Kitasatospora acidiphila TaxID=2567942 RepID=UPI003C761E2C
MDSEPHPTVGVPARDDNQAPATAPTQDRSTARPAQTPRGARNGDHPSRPGALPPAPGRLLAVSARLLAASAVPLLLGLLLAAVSWQVAVNGPLLGLDRAVRHGTAQLRGSLHSGVLDGLAHLLSDLGSTVPAIPVLLGAGVIAAWRLWRTGRPHRWLPPAVAAGAAVLIPLLVVPAKAWFARPGPLGEPLQPHEWGWYPSGHTTTAAISFGVAALLLGRVVRRSWPFTAVAALLWAGVGAGLIWCDYHWFLDVLAGWCLSGLVLWCLARWLRWLPRHERADGSG